MISSNSKRVYYPSQLAQEELEAPFSEEELGKAIDTMEVPFTSHGLLERSSTPQSLALGPTLLRCLHFFKNKIFHHRSLVVQVCLRSINDTIFKIDELGTFSSSDEDVG